jgi:hypothetical protein
LDPESGSPPVQPARVEVTIIKIIIGAMTRIDYSVAEADMKLSADCYLIFVVNNRFTIISNSFRQCYLEHRNMFLLA